METQILEQIITDDGNGLASLTVDQYHQMIAADILPEGSQIELLDGLLVLKDRRDQGGKPMNVCPRHATVVLRLFLAVQQGGATEQTHVRCQQPITLPPDNEPESDVAIVTGQPLDYVDRHPGVSEIIAVMEVADSSLRRDRHVKQGIYAEAGIEAYWIIDVSAEHVELYTNPLTNQRRYGQMQTVNRGDEAALTLPTGAVVTIAVADVLP